MISQSLSDDYLNNLQALSKDTAHKGETLYGQFTSAILHFLFEDKSDNQSQNIT